MAKHTAMAGTFEPPAARKGAVGAAMIDEDEAKQPLGVLLLYALAYAGGVIAYTPFLMLVLPARVAELGGADDIRWLGYIIFGGAFGASVSGVASGWLSDVTRTRRRWVSIGLFATLILLLAIARCDSVEALLALVVAWQVALNLMLVPLIAWAGDFVPDRQKGVLGGLLAIAPAMGAWSGIALAAGAVASFDGRVAVIAMMAAAAVLPLLILAPAERSIHVPINVGRRPDPIARAPGAARMWVARLLMQISGAAMASYLYYWLRDLDPAIGDGEKTALFAVALSTSVPLSLALGRASDRSRRPFAILSATAGVTGAALIAMSLLEGAAAAKLAYVVFVAVGAAFLALHGSQTLRVLPDPRKRALGIGLFNLTNTAPSLVMPWIAITVIPAFGFARLFLLLALLAIAAAMLLASVPRDA